MNAPGQRALQYYYLGRQILSSCFHLYDDGSDMPQVTLYDYELRIDFIAVQR